MRLESVIDKIGEILKEKVPSESFSVRSPNKPLINDEADGFPVMVSQDGGDFEPMADIRLERPDFRISFLLPSDREDLKELVSEAFSDSFVGKFVVFGSGADLQGSDCTMSVITQNACERLDIDTDGVYSRSINELFGAQAKDIRYWTSYDFSLSMSTAKNGGGCSANDDGVIFGNQVSSVISFEYGGTTYQENYKNVETTDSAVSSAYVQQSINGKYQRGIEQSTAYSKTISMAVRNNAFFAKLLEIVRDKELSGVRFSLTRKITFAYGGELTIDQDSNLMCPELPKTTAPGEILTISMTLYPALEVEENA